MSTVRMSRSRSRRHQNESQDENQILDDRAGRIGLGRPASS